MTESILAVSLNFRAFLENLMSDWNVKVSFGYGFENELVIFRVLT